MSIGNDLSTAAQDVSHGISDIFGAINPVNWLSSLGGSIASGIEGAFVAVLKDIWDVIVGPLLVIAGIAIALWVIFLYFLPEISKLAITVARAAV